MRTDPNEIVLVRAGLLDEALNHAKLYLLIRDFLTIEELKTITEDLQSGDDWDSVLSKVKP